MFETVIMMVLAFTAGCSRGDAVGTRTVVADSALVLDVLGSDTVTLLLREADSRLVWTTWDRERKRTRWESASLYYGRPQARLLRFNNDTLPDLFWTLRYEEIIVGMLLVGTDDSGAIQAFVSDDGSCQVPEIRDVTGDGRPEILEYLAGALEPEECTGDAYAQACHDAFPTDWVVVWSLPEGQEKVVAVTPQSFYKQLALDYSDAARRLRKALREQPEFQPSPRCDKEMAASLDSLSHRARTLSGNR